jgi:histone-lysine N-methyltransferase SETMAR
MLVLEDLHPQNYNNYEYYYSPDLALSDFHLFLHLKKFPAGQRFNDDEDVERAEQKWLSSQAATFYDEGIQKLVSRYDKCLNNSGNYVEK